jgi:RNA polymerase sigma-70 factor, ECF subfamily
LDHPVVIQKEVFGVSSIMYSLAQCLARTGAPPGVVVYWQMSQPGFGTWSHLSTMPAERVASETRWAGLIEAVGKSQDRAAFSALFEHFAPRVKTFMRRSGASDTSADELAQETLLTVWRKARLFDPASAGASAWIFTIARNLRIDVLRRESRGSARETSDVDAEFQVDESPLPDSQLATTQSEKRVRAALAELSEEQMQVIELSFYEEKAHAEIAQILQIPLGTVKSRLRLATNRLRNLLGEMS